CARPSLIRALERLPQPRLQVLVDEGLPQTPLAEALVVVDRLVERHALDALLLPDRHHARDAARLAVLVELGPSRDLGARIENLLEQHRAVLDVRERGVRVAESRPSLGRRRVGL